MYRNSRIILFLIVSISVICVTSCKPKPKEKLSAEFSLAKITWKIGDTIRFKNESKNYKTVLWEFGDGLTSSDLNPSHIYNKAGNFYPKIKVDDGKEKLDFALKIIVTSNVSIVLPDTVLIGKEVIFKTNGTAKYNWKIDNNVVAENIELLKQTFPKEGTFKIEIMNPLTKNSVDVKDFTVLKLIVKSESVLPEAAKKVVSITKFPSIVFTGDMIDYATNATDPVLWDFGGKSSSEKTSGQTSFTDEGQYLVKLMDKSSRKILDQKSITVKLIVDDNKFSEWLMQIANNKLSSSEKNSVANTIYSYCLNNGEIPISGMETGSFKDFMRKIRIEANPYETVSISVKVQFNQNKKISGIQLVTFVKNPI
jgi:PKD repeat protein